MYEGTQLQRLPPELLNITERYIGGCNYRVDVMKSNQSVTLVIESGEGNYSFVLDRATYIPDSLLDVAEVIATKRRVSNIRVGHDLSISVWKHNVIFRSGPSQYTIPHCIELIDALREAHRLL